MKMLSPYLLGFIVAFAIVGAAAILIFVRGLRRQQRGLLVGGFLLAGLAGALLDHVIQVIRFARFFGPSA